MPSLLDRRIFSTTRGKVLLMLKKHEFCTVAYLSQQLELTLNAIRQQLSSLESDNLVIQRKYKSGPKKPAHAYSLSSEGDALFPKRHDFLAAMLLNELERTQGETGMRRVLSQIGYEDAGVYLARTGPLPFKEKMNEINSILEQSGSITEWTETERGFLLQDFNCPHAGITKDNPWVCLVRQNFLQRLLEPAQVKAACDHPASRCRFNISTVSESGAGS